MEIKIPCLHLICSSHFLPVVHFIANYPLLLFFVGRFLALEMMTGRRKSSTISKKCTCLANAHTLSCGFLLNLCFIDQCLTTCALFHRGHAADRSAGGSDGHSQGRISLNKTESNNLGSSGLFARSAKLIAPPVKRSHHLGQQHTASSCHG